MATLLVVVVAAGVFLVLIARRVGTCRRRPRRGAAPRPPRPRPARRPPRRQTTDAHGDPDEQRRRRRRHRRARARPRSPLPAPLATLTFLNLKLDPTGAPDAPPQDHPVQHATAAGRLVQREARDVAPSGATPAQDPHVPEGRREGDRLQRHHVGDLHRQDQARRTRTGRSPSRAPAAAAPIVDLTVTFQSLAPSVKIEHARFDGTGFPRHERDPGTVHRARHGLGPSRRRLGRSPVRLRDRPVRRDVGDRGRVAGEPGAVHEHRPDAPGRSRRLAARPPEHRGRLRDDRPDSDDRLALTTVCAPRATGA